MTILDAAQCTNPKAAAIAYATAGISVIPLFGKKPTLKQWQIHQDRRADSFLIHKWSKAGLFRNVGIVCGGVSGNLVVIDLDSDRAIDQYELTFPALLDTFTVKTGSGHGKHLYYYVDNLPPTRRVMNVSGANFELRANGCYVVAPPSVHPDTGLQYRVLKSLPVLRLLNMDGVLSWLSTLANRHQSQQAAPQKPRLPGKYPGWAERALGYETRDVQLAPEGTRNDRLNVAAYNIGQLVGDGLLARATVESALLSAALRAGLNERESLNTIQSGLDRGIAEPRSAQWRKRGKNPQ